MMKKKLFGKRTFLLLLLLFMTGMRVLAEEELAEQAETEAGDFRLNLMTEEELQMGIMPAAAVNVDLSLTNNYTISNSGEYNIFQSDQAADGRIIVNGNNLDVIINIVSDITISRPNAPITLIGENTDVILNLGKNTTATLTNTADTETNITAGIYVPNGIHLTITAEAVINSSDTTGKLIARGALGGAGIGGILLEEKAGWITIEDGEIYAYGSPFFETNSGYNRGSAGIGGGTWGNNGTVEITGGSVNAVGRGGEGGAGIGGGCWGGSGIVIIAGGKVTTSGSPGIGSGGVVSNNDNENSVYITGPDTVVHTTGLGAASGIGSAQGGRSPDVIIDSGMVTAISQSAGAGIGAPDLGSTGDIIITGSADVTAVGGPLRATAGIGDSNTTYNTTITIDATATVRAYALNTTCPAIYAANMNGTANYVNAYLTTGPINAAQEAEIEIYEDGWGTFASGASVTTPDRLTLPANYQCFAYTTGGSPTRTNLKVSVAGYPDRYLTYESDYQPGSQLVGTNGSLQIHSTINQSESLATLQNLKLTTLELAVKKTTDQHAAGTDSFVYRIEYESTSGAVKKVYYTIVDVSGGNTGEKVVYGLPGKYTVTEIDGNWRYELDTNQSDRIQRIDDAGLLSVADTTKVEFEYVNEKTKNEWVSGSGTVHNKLQSFND